MHRARSKQPASATRAPALGATLVALALSPAGPPQLSAQSPPDTSAAQHIRQQIPDTSAAQHIRQQIQERWIHQDQPARFVRFQPHVRSFELHEIQGGSYPPDGRRWTVDSDNHDAEVTLDSLGRVTHLHVQLRRLSYAPYPRHYANVRLFQGSGEVLRLPSSRVRELWLSLPDAPLSAGVTWTDTLSFIDEPTHGLRESYHAIRTHRVLGDTLLDGRALPRIGTQAEIRYESSLLEPLLAHVRRTTRELTGQVVGTMVVDTATGLQIAGLDTARWQGTATLHDTVSGPYVSDVRFERTRTWTWYDSTRHRAFVDSVWAARERQSTGMRIVPTDPLAERLAAGDSALADSLIARWPLARDLDEILRIRSLFRAYGHGAGRARSELDSLAHVFALSRGDTAAAIEVARRYVSYQTNERLNRAQAEFLLPYLNDPERYWRLGAPEWYDFTELARTLLRASPLLEPDTSRWGCRPAACELFLEQLEQAAEPRLRDLALVGLFARDPARWHDRLLERHEAGSPVTAEAVHWAQGIPDDGGAPLPDANAGWEAWRAWWGTRPDLRGSHPYALRLHAAVTGRDAVAELVAAWPLEGDSAQAVVGEILRAMDAIPELTVEELREDVLSGDPARISRAQRYLRSRLYEEADTVPPEDAVDLLAPLVDSLLVRADAPWPAAPGAVPDGEPRIYHEARSAHGVEGVPVFVLTEWLPASVLEALPADVQAITPEDWAARDRRAGGYLIRFHPVRRRASFVQLAWVWTVMRRRAPDEAPAGYAGGGSLTLVETDEGWVVVGRGAWIS